jgi:predicted dehydrogenase
MAQRVKVGVIGCGFFAGDYLNAWNELAANGAELAAVCDVDRSRAQAAARKFGMASPNISIRWSCWSRPGSAWSISSPACTPIAISSA